VATLQWLDGRGPSGANPDFDSGLVPPLKLSWRVAVSRPFRAITVGETIILSSNSDLSALDVSAGNVLWRNAGPWKDIKCHPLVSEGNKVFFRTGNYLVALSMRSGTLAFRKILPKEVRDWIQYSIQADLLCFDKYGLSLDSGDVVADHSSQSFDYYAGVGLSDSILLRKRAAKPLQ